MAKLNDASANFTGDANAATGSAPVTLGSAVQQVKAQGAQFYPLVVSRRQLLDGIRHHVMRLQNPKEKSPVDICDETQFTRPVRLHRRDPRAPPSGAGATFVEDDSPEDIEESKERERQEIIKEERRRIKEENQAKIAPSITKKAPAFQKKTNQIFRADDTPEAQKRAKLRYEEALPWHLEDFDNKQTWVGQYESELSEAHVTIAPESDPNGNVKFRMVPIEKWYKFTAKSNRKVIPTEEADKDSNVERVPKFMRKIEQISIKLEREKAMKEKGPGRMRTRVGGAGDDDEVPRAGEDGAPVKIEADADDIDFNLDEDFADDEEGLNGLFEGDEADTKAAEEKLRRDRLAARIFDLVDENKVLAQEEAENEAQQLEKPFEKSARKLLRKREKNFDYEESDSNPYTSSSEDETDSEAERQKEKERKEEEEKKKAAEKSGEQNGKAKEGEKPPSGASTKGTTTPSGPPKPMDPNKKKRPGSPNLSEASGNESSRKKQKQKHLETSRKPSLVNMASSINRGAGSGSESEMPDGGKQKAKVFLRTGTSPTVTPGGSRAASPDSTQLSASRAGSPAGSVATGSQASAAFPTPQEIYNALPPQGSTIQALLRVFKGRLTKKESLFVQLVRTIGRFDKDNGVIYPREKMPDEKTLQKAYDAAEKKPKKAAAS
jgi:transcription initiation factor TFIIF subunit alpha